MVLLTYPKEPWHIRYFSGDHIPAAVLDYEESLRPEPPARIPTTEDCPMLFKTQAGSVVQLLDGKLVLVLDATDGIDADELRQVAAIQDSMPADQREPVLCSRPYWQRLVTAFGPVVR
jgi:hypothetical protein